MLKFSGRYFPLFFAVALLAVVIINTSPPATTKNAEPQITASITSSPQQDEEQQRIAQEQALAQLPALQKLPEEDASQGDSHSNGTRSNQTLSFGSDKSDLRSVAGWKAGLNEFNKGDMEKAAEHFVAILKDADLCGSDRAAVAFWAYRALSAKGDSQSAHSYLNKAANENTGFYSIIARQVAGLEAIPHKLEAGMIVSADNKSTTPYPMPNWIPASGGYKVEQALLFAIVRQESRFNPVAHGSGGAMGVMQLMPATAHAMARNINVKGSMSDPSVSMALGQQYIQNLMQEDSIGKNLVFVLAAYNAGPGNLEKWQDEIAYNNDPLFFIESIPFGTTRDYVVNVMGNYWVYSEMLGNDIQPLAMISKGSWPVYAGAPKKVVSAKIDFE